MQPFFKKTLFLAVIAGFAMFGLTHHGVAQKKITIVGTTNKQSKTVASKADNVRKLTVKSYCPFDVWIGISPGDAPNKSSPPITGAFTSAIKASMKSECHQDSDCYLGSGATCNQTADTSEPCTTSSSCKCGYALPQTTTKSGIEKYHLNPYVTGQQPDAIVFTFPIPNDANGTNYVWNGRFFGRTGCKNGHCETGDQCGWDANTGMCSPYGRTTGGVVLLEWTLKKYALLDTTQDFDNYNLSFLNSANLATTEGTPDNVSESDKDHNDPFQCTSAGDPTPNPDSGLPPCKWNFEDTMTGANQPQPYITGVVDPTEFRRILYDKSNRSCVKEGDCPSGTECGYALNIDKLYKQCGKKIGYWHPYDECGVTSGNFSGKYFTCSDTTDIDTSIYANWKALAGCESPSSTVHAPSCYTEGAPKNCCGCYNWWVKNANLDPEIPFPKSVQTPTNTCISTYDSWMNKVGKYIQWMKRACPYSYAWAYDDKMSSFKCQHTDTPPVSNQTLNSATYTLTFCPENKKPSGPYIGWPDSTNSDRPDPAKPANGFVLITDIPNGKGGALFKPTAKVINPTGIPDVTPKNIGTDPVSYTCEIVDDQSATCTTVPTRKVITVAGVKITDSLVKVTASATVNGQNLTNIGQMKIKFLVPTITPPTLTCASPINVGATSHCTWTAATATPPDGLTFRYQVKDGSTAIGQPTSDLQMDLTGLAAGTHPIRVTAMTIYDNTQLTGDSNVVNVLVNAPTPPLNPPTGLGITCRSSGRMINQLVVSYGPASGGQPPLTYSAAVSASPRCSAGSVPGTPGTYTIGASGQPNSCTFTLTVTVKDGSGQPSKSSQYQTHC